MPRKNKSTQHKVRIGQADVIIDTDSVSPEHFIEAGLNEHVLSINIDFVKEIKNLETEGT